AGHFPDVAAVLSVRTIRMAEPEPQERAGVPARPPAAAWSALSIWCRRSHAARLLSGLSRDGDRSECRRLLAKLARAAVLAQRTAMVRLAASGAQYPGGRPELHCAERSTGARSAVR